MTGKRWVWSKSGLSVQAQGLAQCLSIPVALAGILVDRSVDTFDQAKRFFRPCLDHWRNPFAMKGMEGAVLRLHHALSQKERILVYGDYDVDGITSVALVFSFLREQGADVGYYIPSRYNEGYGVSVLAIEQAVRDGVGLVIALDCGIKDYDALALARSKGINVIVCDHHQIGDRLPLACAILNPKQEDCSYGFSHLSGCGIGFKLLQGLCIKTDIDVRRLYHYLDLVALSCLCDLVPLVDENRLFVFYGLKKLAKRPNLGLGALMDLYGISSPSAADLIYKIGPCVNSAGRMHHANAALELLIEQDDKRTKDLAATLFACNQSRQALDKQVTGEALAVIDSLPGSKKSYVLFKEDWHKGILGIVASRCVEQYYRPTIILTYAEGSVVGSARSVDGYDIHRAIASCGDLLDRFGGHAFAAGLSLPLDQLTRFQERFEQVVEGSISDELLVVQQRIHAWIPLQMISLRLAKLVAQMAPFGVGNPVPVFATYGLYACHSAIVQDKHLKLEVYQPGCAAHYEAIGFGLSHLRPLVAEGQPFCMAYTLDYTQYWGYPSIQLRIQDIQPVACIDWQN